MLLPVLLWRTQNCSVAIMDVTSVSKCEFGLVESHIQKSMAWFWGRITTLEIKCKKNTIMVTPYSPFCRLTWLQLSLFITCTSVALGLWGNYSSSGPKKESAESECLPSNLQDSIPSDFARSPRSINRVEIWKATEFRQFMLYTGKLVMEGILDDELYKHFMVFIVAMGILVCPQLLKDHSAYAHEPLKYFVQCNFVLDLIIKQIATHAGQLCCFHLSSKTCCQKSELKLLPTQSVAFPFFFTKKK